MRDPQRCTRAEHLHRMHPIGGKHGPPTEAFEVPPPLLRCLRNAGAPIGDITCVEGHRGEVPHRAVGVVEEHRGFPLRVVRHRLIGTHTMELHRGTDDQGRVDPIHEVLPGDSWRILRRALVVVVGPCDVLHHLVPTSTTANRGTARGRSLHDVPRREVPSERCPERGADRC